MTKLPESCRSPGCEDGTVSGDLAPGSEFHNVLPHQLGGGQFRHRSIPHCTHLGGREQRELIDGPLGADLLHDADGGIGRHDEQEGGVLPVTHQQQTGRQHHKDQVEIGKQILPDDLLVRFGRGLHGAVVPSSLRQFPGLGGGQSPVGGGMVQGHLPPGDRLCRFLFFAFHRRFPSKNMENVESGPIIPVPGELVQRRSKFCKKAPRRFRQGALRAGFSVCSPWAAPDSAAPP